MNARHRLPQGPAVAAWSWPPPTRLLCRRRPPGTWPPTCPTPTQPKPLPARTRRPTSPRSSASTASGPGSSRATNRLKTNSAGPTSKSAPTAPSAATRPWSTAPSPSAGTSGSPHPDRWMPPRRTHTPTRGQRRGTAPVPPAPTALLAQGLTRHPLLAHPRHHPQPMVASLDGQGPTLRAPGPDRRGHHRTRH